MYNKINLDHRISLASNIEALVALAGSGSREALGAFKPLKFADSSR